MWKPLPLDHHRVSIIGQAVMKMPGKIVGVSVDSIEEKIDWYLAEIPKNFSKIKVIDHFEGPVEGVHTIRICRRQEGMG